MKITTFLSVNNENLGAIAHMSNGTYICIVYKGVKVAPKQGFQKYVLSYTTVLHSALNIFVFSDRFPDFHALQCFFVLVKSILCDKALILWISI